MTRRKKTTDTPSLSTTSSKKHTGKKKSVPLNKKTLKEEITSDENYVLKNMIKQQLGDYIRKNKIKDDTAALLSNMLQEYLSSCILLGYDFSGQPVNIISVNNQQDADALGTQLQRFITNSQGYGPPPGAPPEPPIM